MPVEDTAMFQQQITQQQFNANLELAKQSQLYAHRQQMAHELGDPACFLGSVLLILVTLGILFLKNLKSRERIEMSRHAIDLEKARLESAADRCEYHEEHDDYPLKVNIDGILADYLGIPGGPLTQKAEEAAEKLFDLIKPGGHP